MTRTMSDRMNSAETILGETLFGWLHVACLPFLFLGPAPSLRSGASAQPHTLALSPSVCIGFAASLDERRRIAEHNLCGP